MLLKDNQINLMQFVLFINFYLYLVIEMHYRLMFKDLNQNLKVESLRLYLLSYRNVILIVDLFLVFTYVEDINY